jgi:hypothetical protein
MLHFAAGALEYPLHEPGAICADTECQQAISKTDPKPSMSALGRKQPLQNDQLRDHAGSVR